MEWYDVIQEIDPSKLTTTDRRAFLERMKKYLEYFQKMQKRAENHNIIDRVVASIKTKETKKNREKEQDRLKKYFKLISQMYIKTKTADVDPTTLSTGTAIPSLSGVAASCECMDVGGFYRQPSPYSDSE